MWTLDIVRFHTKAGKGGIYMDILFMWNMCWLMRKGQTSGHISNFIYSYQLMHLLDQKLETREKVENMGSIKLKNWKKNVR